MGPIIVSFLLLENQDFVFNIEELKELIRY